MRIRFAVALLALSLVSAGRPDPAPAGEIVYQFRLVERDGLGWRAEHHARLSPIRAIGAGAVWTAPKEVAEALAAPGARCLAAPKVIAAENAAAHVSTRKATRWGTKAQAAETCPDEAEAEADHCDEPEADDTAEDAVREGVALTVVGRTLDQGILARVALDDTRIQAVHTVRLTPTAGMPCCESKEGGQCAGASAAVAQVPEITSASAAGEWLIPKDGALVVSLGVYTVAGPDGKAVVRERLALLEARPAPATPTDPKASAAIPVPFAPLASPSSPPVPIVLDMAWPVAAAAPAVAVTPTPKAPTRVLPIALNEHGEPIELPPLPDFAPPTRLDSSSDPCGSPQFTSAAPPPPARLAGRTDPGLTRAMYSEERPRTETPGPGRSFRYRTPDGRFSIELRAATTPPSDDKAPPPPFAPRD